MFNYYYYHYYFSIDAYVENVLICVILASPFIISITHHLLHRPSSSSLMSFRISCQNPIFLNLFCLDIFHINIYVRITQYSIPLLLCMSCKTYKALIYAMSVIFGRTYSSQQTKIFAIKYEIWPKLQHDLKQVFPTLYHRGPSSRILFRHGPP